MEKKKTLGEMLREKREQLGHGQEYIYTKLNLTQPSYSWIENDKVKFTPQLINEIKSIKDFEDFDGSGNYQASELHDEPHSNNLDSEGLTLEERWPWGKPPFYFVVIVLGAFCLDMLFQMGIFFYLGITGEADVNKDITALIAVIYFVLGVLLIRWLAFRKEW